MNGFSIAGLFFVAIPSLIVGPFILIKGRKKVHLLWSAFLSAVSLWGFGMFKIGMSANPTASIFWWRIAEIGVIFIPVFLVHFVISFLSLKRRIFLALFYIATFLLLYFNIFTDYFIKDLYFAFNQFYYISATPLYSIFIGIFVGSVAYVLFELFRAYKKTTSVIRYQIKYLILAFFVGFSGGLTSYFPVYRIPIYPAWNATIFISVLMVAYAILRYRLMDLRIVARKIVIYFASAAFTYGVFFFLAWTFIKYFGGIFTNTAYLSGLVIAPIFVATFLWFFSFIQKIANRYFFYSLYNYQETINDLSQKLNYLNDLDEIINLIVDTVKKALQLDRTGVLLVEENREQIQYRIAKVIGFNERNGISLVQDNFLTKYLKETQKPLVRDELALLARDSKNRIERKGFLELENNMKRIEASLCLPLMSSKKLIGIVVLGSKISRDAYTKEDLELLNTLAFQAGIAVDNARLYKEIQDFNETLQQKVDEQTKEIKDAYKKVEKAYTVEKKARKELERLDKAKSQFMMATQHHLRTPLTSMYGYLDLLLAGSFGKIPKKIGEILSRFKKSTKNEINIVEDLLRISQFQLGRRVVTLRPDVDIEPVLKDIVEEVKIEADKKGIYIKLEKPNKIPKINADTEKLKLAIYNIIDNAVKYTTEGGVTVKIEITDNKLRIITQDTGMGLDKEQAEDLFSRLFERGEKAQKLYAVGRGIGLYTAANLIKEHNGKIWVESEGPGKGSTFFIELPIK